jgi:retinol dehydrogenase 12
MDKPICLITGATDGIGKVTATALAGKGYAVVLAARYQAKAATVTKEIVASTGNRDVDYLTADLTSLAQLHRLAETFTLRYPRLDVLINNAGIVMPTRAVTEDGYETTFQVNYLLQFCLTHLLLNELKRSPQGRIINLSSSVYRAGKFDPDNLQGEHRFSTIGAYAASKLLVLLFTIELAHRLEPTRVTANAVHPGIVRTPMMRGRQESSGRSPMRRCRFRSRRTKALPRRSSSPRPNSQRRSPDNTSPAPKRRRSRPPTTRSRTGTRCGP